MTDEIPAPLFDDDPGFHQALHCLLGEKTVAEAALQAHWIATPVGPLLAVADATHLRLLEFFDRGILPAELHKLQASAGSGIALGCPAPIHALTAELQAYFQGRSASFTTPLAPVGTRFEQRAWKALLDVPAGETRSYGEQARALGQPTATRAVARANGANPIALVIPCHRIIGADGSLTGYGGGLWRKRWLIDHERRAFGHVLI
ncbi:methylated-DNA--[protein]-cysteine S-methyltransferase [Maricaulis sp.]|uniref:methylated-DNA--[protein]-cysteine S-methyltransferase n=1 Tax=Maricaulis sp. TaxID=1486257 RepID=UPI002B274A1F|nr:methylated-DNA--[protein]-cysteine S-methyltransferase [Maricaulis sp.]